MSRPRPSSLLVVATALSAGCVARTAGFAESSTLVLDRTGHVLHADPEQPDEGGVSPEARRLLAAPLDPERAAQVALLENRGLLAELADLGVARASLVGAGLLPNPRIEGEILLADGQDTTTYSATATIGLAPLLRLPSRRGVASVALEAAAMRAAGRALDLAFDARVATLRHVADLRRVALRHTDLEAPNDRRVGASRKCELSRSRANRSRGSTRCSR